MGKVYGVTEFGFVRKRLDSIQEDIYAVIKEGWGYDVTIQPQTVLNVLVTGIADEIAAVWEAAEDEYYAMYPTSAEGASLDNSIQFSGISRERDTRTNYMISCTAPDETLVEYGVIIRSATNPQKLFRCVNPQTISHNNFRQVEIKPYLDTEDTLFYLTINGINVQYVLQEGDTEEDVLNGLQTKIDIKGINTQVDNNKGSLLLYDSNKQTSNTLSQSNNLLVQEVISNILFESVEYGPVKIPTGLIKEIITGSTGIKSVCNDIAPVLGRLAADDIETRQSYIQRSATRSKNMVDSIVAGIYDTVDLVEAVKGYENDTDKMDSSGRPPHCVEIVVDGGDEGEIANVIYNKKTNGIQAYGNTRMDVADIYGNIHKIAFSRPDYLFVWLRISITPKPGEPFAPNYTKLVRNSILARKVTVGENVYLQTYLADIYKNVIGVAMVDIKAYVTESKIQIPTDYLLSNIVVNERQKAVFDTSRIEVVLDE